jgi:hypothetical protein
VVADFTSIESLTSAFKGQDAVVCTFGTPDALAGQNIMIDAAIAVGVKLFVPSEFGSDVSNPLARALPVYGAKVAVEEYLKQKAATGAIAYVFLYSGAFLDWGLQVGFLQNTTGRQAKLFDGGDCKFSASTLATVGIALTRVLQKFEETKNRVVYVHDTILTPKKLLEYAKEATPGDNWKVETVSTSELEKKAYEDLQSGNIHDGVWYSFLYRAIFGEGYGGFLTKTDNALLGFKEKSESEIKAIIAKCAKKV